MEHSATSSSTSSQNQPTGSFQSHISGSFENQPLRRQRKHGIAAVFLGDTSNLPVADVPRPCKEKAECKIAASSMPQYNQRGDSLKGVMTKQQKQTGLSDNTLYRIIEKFSTKGSRQYRILYVEMCHGRYKDNSNTNNDRSNDTT